MLAPGRLPPLPHFYLSVCGVSLYLKTNIFDSRQDIERCICRLMGGTSKAEITGRRKWLSCPKGELRAGVISAAIRRAPGGSPFSEFHVLSLARRPLHVCCSILVTQNSFPLLIVDEEGAVGVGKFSPCGHSDWCTLPTHIANSPHCDTRRLLLPQSSLKMSSVRQKALSFYRRYF